MGKWTKFCNCICYCCVQWLFNCLNSGAYCFIHLSGNAYCTSALQVLKQKLSEPLSTSVITIVNLLVVFLMKLSIISLTCFISYLIIRNVEAWNVDSVAFPLILCALIAYVICSFFTSLYSEAIQAIYVCFLIDKQAGGGEDRCPPELKQLLENAKLEKS